LSELGFMGLLGGMGFKSLFQMKFIQ